MITIKCDPEKGGCGGCYEINEEAVKKDNYLQCPLCGRVSQNPLKEI